jgi:hypothetical protein
MFVVDHLSHSSRYFLDGKIKITVFLTNLREKIVAQTASTLKSNMAANRGRGNCNHEIFSGYALTSSKEH